MRKKLFWSFFQRGDPLMLKQLKKDSFIFPIFQNFLCKMASMGRGKCWKKQSHEIWAHLEHPLRNHERSSTRGGSVNHPPCRIGLKWKHNSSNPQAPQEIFSMTRSSLMSGTMPTDQIVTFLITPIQRV